MAEPVIVPVQAKLVDVDTSQLNFADVSKEISKSMTGIKKSIQDAFKGIDPSAINKPIEQAMTSVKKSVQAAEDAQLRYNEALIKAGKSSKEYKSAIKEADSKISGQQEIVNELSQLGPSVAPVLAAERAKLDELIEAHNKLNPVDFVDSAEPIQLEKIANAYKKVLSAQEEVNKRSENFNKVAHDNRFSDEYNKMAKEAEDYGKKLQALDEKFKNMENYGASKNQWQKARDQADAYSDKLDEVIAKMRAAVGNNSAFRFGDGNKDEANAQINQLASAKSSNIGKQANIGNITRVASTIKSAFAKVSPAIKKVSSSIFGCVKHMKLFGKSGGSVSNDLTKRFKKLGKNILMFGFGFRTAYFAVKRLRNIFIEGFKLMGDEFDEFGEPMKRMIESFNRLKGSLATAFQPLASVVMPILTKAMNYLSNMLEAIGKFNAALTGQGYIYKAIAKDVNSVAGAAKNANNQLASYDKLEVIQDNNLGYDYEKQTLGETDRAVSDFATMVKEAWEKANFKGVGVYVTEQLLKVLDNVEKNIIPKVTSFVNRVLSSVNTFFEGFDSNAIGAKLGSIINTIVDGLDWEQLGMMFANLHNVVWDFVDGLVNAINWEELGESLTTGVNSLFSTLKIESLIGAVSGLAKGLVKLFISAITLIDWKSIANTLLSAIHSLLQSIGNDMVNSNNPIVAAFGEVVLAIDKTISKLRPAFEAVIAAVSPLIQSILPIFSELLPPIAEIVSDLVVTVLPPLVKLISSLLPPIIRLVVALLPFIKDFLSYIFVEIANLADFISTVIVPIFDLLVSAVEIVSVVIQSLFKAMKGDFKSVEGLFESLRKIWKSPIEGIRGMINALVTSVVKGLNSMIKGLNKIKINIPDWSFIPKEYRGASLSMNIPEIPIPKLAQGAVIPPNQEFLAMLGDQRHGTNIEAPLDTIKQALAEVLAEVGGGNREPIVLQVNGRTLAKVVWDEQEKRYKQTGKYSPA